MSLVKIKDLFHFEKGTLQSTKAIPGEFYFITAAADWKTHNEYTHDCEALIFAAAASGSLGRTHYVNGKFISSDLCFIITPKDPYKYPIDIQFYHLIFNEFKEEIVRNTKSGTSKEAIGLTVFGNYELPYFGIEKQKKTRELFLKAQELSYSLDSEFTNQLDIIKNLRQAFLKEAIQGKLVKQDFNEEPANLLLTKIKSEKERLIKEKKIKKEKLFLNISQEEIPFEIPKNWVWCRLGEITNIQRGSSPRPKGDPRYFSQGETEFNWITISDITQNSHNNILQSTNEYLTKEGSKHSRFVDNNEFIIAVSGSTTGKCCLTGIKGFIYDGLAVAKVIAEGLFPNYLLSFMMGHYELINSSKTGASFPNINTDYLNNLPISFPPFSEQKRIVSKLNELLKFCDGLEKSIEFEQKKISLLLQQQLREALGLKWTVEKNTTQNPHKSTSYESKFDANTLLMEIQELLKIHGKLDALELWQMSKFFGRTDEERNIDGFYAELKKLIEKEKVVKETDKGYLELV